MDVSYTNVLEGARQYFQGLPSPALSGSPSQPVVLAPASGAGAGAGAPHATPDPPPDARYEHVAAGVPTSSVPPPAMLPQPPASASVAAAAVVVAAAPTPSNVPTYWPPIATASPYQRKELTPSPQVRVSTPQSMQHSKTPTSSSFSSAFNGSRGSGEESAQPSTQPPAAAQRPLGHNLPPIAALSNYHSSRSSGAHKAQALPVSHAAVAAAAAAAAASSKTFQRALQSEYTLPRQNQAQYVSAAASGATRLQYGQQGPKYQQLGVVPSSAATPTPTPAVAASTSYHSFPPATSSAAISSTPAPTPSSAPAPPMSSLAPTQPHYAYHASPGERPPKPASRSAYPAQAPYYPATPPAVPHHGVLVNGHQHQKPPTPAPGARPTAPGGAARVKRESPLDLSVKTVRQSADSTADDSEGFGSRSYASPAPPPTAKGRAPLALPTPAAAGGYPSLQGTPRVPTPRNVPASAPAPKIDIDFVGNFAVHHQQQQQQQQQQQHGAATGTHYAHPDALQRPKERLQPYPQQSSSSLAPIVPHLGGFKPISTQGAYESKPALAAYNHVPPMPYDPKQVQPPVYNHKMPTQPTPSYDNKYGPFPTYNPKPTGQAVVSKAPQQPGYDHKSMQPGLYGNAYPKQQQQQQQVYEHKLQQSASFDYNKKVQQPNMDHKQALQSSYDQNKHTNMLKYDQKPVAHGMAQSQSKTWEHKKQAQIQSFDYKSGPPQLSSLEHKSHAYPATPQHQLQQQRLPAKTPSVTQPYSNHQFPGAPQPPPGGYEPSKRPAELPAGYPNNRPSYRPLPTNTAYPNQSAPGHKRPAEQSQQAPSNKVPRVNDTWRQTIDQEIEQRFSSYTSSRLQQSVNGNAENTSTSRQEAAYLQRQNHIAGQQHAGRPNPPQQNYSQHPVAGNHGTPQYPPHQQHPRTGASLPRMLAMAPRTGRNRAVPGGGAANKRVLNILRNTLEEKEARMTQLQNQLQHNAQLQQQYQQRQPQTSEAPVQMMHQQKPAVSPTLPPGRHNLPPHGAGLENSHSKLGAARDLTRPGAHLDAAGAANTQAMLADITRQQQQQPPPPPPPPPPPVADLEGFAAYLAARIRTKGELKQVGPSMEQMSSMHQQHFRCPTPSSSVVSASNSRAHSPRSTPGAAAVFSPPPPTSAPSGSAHDETAPTPGPASAGGSPPKLTRERVVVPPPRRRLFSRPEEEMGCPPDGAPVGVAPPSLPLRDSTGLRSSSETSVFDFRDSDSEGEMPVLERQTLNEMRKDRRLHPSKQAPSESGGPSEETGKEDDYDKDEDELDPFWSATCESFVEQLRTGVNPEGPKRGRGRRKKADESKSKLVVLKREEAVVVCEKVEIKLEKTIKVEAAESIEVKEETLEATKSEAAEGSEETAAAKRHGRLKSEEDDVEDEMSLAEMKARLGKRRDSGSEPSDSEASDDDDDAAPKESVTKRLRARKGQDKSPGMKLRSKESPSAASTPRKAKTTPTKAGKGKKKPSFGDGSDFAPGWEEQVYLFKRSLRMPAGLINIPRPRDATRLCASLPDLDPCPDSPAAEFPARRGLLRRWADVDVDSDLDSASNLSTPLDSEDATSSSLSSRFKAKDKNNLLSIIVQKYSQSKVERNKSDKKCGDSELSSSRKSKAETESPVKVGADVVKPPAKKGRPFKKKNVKEELVPSKDTGQLRRFRKKSATTFREAFLANGDAFALKSRTRRQTLLHQRATLREVFGDERPASAPPACGDGSDSDDGDAKKSSASRGRSVALARSNKAVLNSKRRLLQGGRRRNPNLIRALASKTLLDLGDAAMDLDAIGDDILAGKVPLLKKRMKLRNVRRKFRSGFDYIRKKKKPIKKDVDSEGIVIIREKQKRHTILRPSSESVQDIQNEIRGWVINKGLGETLLHRAARLGYTDVAAYCLEKLDNPASPRDNAGYTPLHEACSRGHMDIARLLLMYGANVSDGAVGGVRPLHEATENGFIEMMRLLLSYGADPLLATYSGQTPLAMANDEEARRLLQLHLADVQGLPAQPWFFQEYAACERVESGFNVLQDPPCLSPEAVEDDDIEMELSDMALPVLYRLRGDSPADRWVLLQDLTALLRAKSKDSLLRQLSPEPRNLIKELKMADFLEQARCCHLLGGGERINVRASKVALVPYNDKVREMLGVERIAVSSR